MNRLHSAEHLPEHASRPAFGTSPVPGTSRRLCRKEFFIQRIDDIDPEPFDALLERVNQWLEQEQVNPVSVETIAHDSRHHLSDRGIRVWYQVSAMPADAQQGN